MAEQKGTGQHKHKSSEEPHPHHEGRTTKDDGTAQRSSTTDSTSSQHSSNSSQSASGTEGSRGRSNSEDMKSREYKDSHGEVHHHTKKYEEEHGNR